MFPREMKIFTPWRWLTCHKCKLLGMFREFVSVNSPLWMNSALIPVPFKKGDKNTQHKVFSLKTEIAKCMLLFIFRTQLNISDWATIFEKICMGFQTPHLLEGMGTDMENCILVWFVVHDTKTPPPPPIHSYKPNRLDVVEYPSCAWNTKIIAVRHQILLYLLSKFSKHWIYKGHRRCPQESTFWGNEVQIQEV